MKTNTRGSKFTSVKTTQLATEPETIITINNDKAKIAIILTKLINRLKIVCIDVPTENHTSTLLMGEL